MMLEQPLLTFSIYVSVDDGNTDMALAESDDCGEGF